jgi:hypothetical protein
VVRRVGILALRTDCNPKINSPKANELSVRAGSVARDLTPGFEELQTLKAREAQIRTALDDPLARQKVGDLRQVETAYDAVTRAILTWLDPADKDRRLDELEIHTMTQHHSPKAQISHRRRHPHRDANRRQPHHGRGCGTTTWDC